MRKLIAAMLCCLALAGNSIAADNYQDWWWNPSMDGMGWNIGHQGNVLAVSWYHYDAQGNATYLLLAGALSGNTLTGDLSRSTGPLPGPSYDPASVGRTTVGTATLTFNSRDSATFDYAYDGLSGTIQLQRFSFSDADFSGSWHFANFVTATGCMSASNNGSERETGSLTFTHSGSTLTPSFVFDESDTASFTLTVTKSGSSYSGTGTWTASDGGANLSGNVTVSKLRIVDGFLMMDYVATAVVGETCVNTGTVTGRLQ